MEETLTYKGYLIKIETDNEPLHPRKAWDNLGTLATRHPRYNLGEETISDHIDWLAEKLEIDDDQHERIAQKHKWDPYSGELAKHLESIFCRHYIALPVYVYEHSGITIRTSPFSCTWDSSQLGYIYLSNEKAREEFGWKALTKNRREKIISYLKGEIKTLDQYLTDEVYGYTVNTPTGEEIDSSWGFYGDDHSESGLIEQATGVINAQIRWQIKVHTHKLRQWIRSKVPYIYRKPCSVQ